MAVLRNRLEDLARIEDVEPLDGVPLVDNLGVPYTDRPWNFTAQTQFAEEGLVGEFFPIGNEIAFHGFATNVLDVLARQEFLRIRDYSFVQRVTEVSGTASLRLKDAEKFSRFVERTIGGRSDLLVRGWVATTSSGRAFGLLRPARAGQSAGREL